MDPRRLAGLNEMKNSNVLVQELSPNLRQSYTLNFGYGRVRNATGKIQAKERAFAQCVPYGLSVRGACVRYLKKHKLNISMYLRIHESYTDSKDKFLTRSVSRAIIEGRERSQLTYTNTIACIELRPNPVLPAQSARRPTCTHNPLSRPPTPTRPPTRTP